MQILVFQHLAVEHSGSLGQLWREAGHVETIVELDEGEPIPPLEGFDMLIAMGGPMDVWQEDIHPWLAPEKAAIRRWVKELDRPYLGICLGHQLLASALGWHVGLMAAPEVGLRKVELTEVGRRDPIFAGIDPVLETLQWHGAEIQTLPEGAQVLAANAACPTQAIRCGRWAYGFQFHVEITGSTVGDWERIPEYKASLERALGPTEASKLATTIEPRLASFRQTAKRVNDNFLSLIKQGGIR